MDLEPFHHAFALTGSIATGKSTVVTFLKEEGFHIIDADKIAHEILNEQAQIIAETFGEEFVKEKRVDRKALGRLIFSDNKKRKELEALLHPLIYARIVEKAEPLEKREEPYIIDIPLFFESGRYAIEKVIVVYTTKEQQLERMMNRDGLSKEEALWRIEAQIDIEDKVKYASYVIDNRGDLKQLQSETIRVKEEILGEL